MTISIVFSFFILLTFVFPSALNAENAKLSGMAIHADTMDRDFENKTLTLSGNVQLVFNQTYLACEKATIYIEKSLVIAEGKVILENSQVHAEAARAEFNYQNQLGVFYDAFIKSGQVMFEGSIIRKVGDIEYEAEDTRYTSCVTCPPDWSFTGSKLEAELGGYAYIKAPVLRVFNFPIFILPAILVPLKSSRQSGFLVPGLEFSGNGGKAISVPYFWALNESNDITFTAKNYDTKGLKGLGEYRYVLDDESYGQLNFGYLYDKDFSEDGDLTQSTIKLDRGYAKYIHLFTLPDNYIQRANVNYVSDLRFVRDFPEDIAGHGDPALSNSLSLTHNSDDSHKSIETTYYIDLLQNESRSNNHNAVHRLPDLRYSILEQPLMGSNLRLKLDLRYTQFSRDNFGYDDITGSGKNKKAATTRDGSFDPSNDLIRTGHRLLLSPTLTYPLQLGKYLDVLPKVSYNEAQYRFTAQSTDPTYSPIATRRFYETSLSVKTIFSRIFSNQDMDNKADGAVSYKHEVVPSVSFSRIAWVKRPQHVFFGDFENQPYSRQSENISNQDFFGSSKIQFDYFDRVFDKKLITFGVDNNFVRKTLDKQTARYHKVARFSLSQAYDFNELQRESPQPWSEMTGLLDVRLNSFETNTKIEYFPYAKVNNLFSRMRFKEESGDFVEIHYTQDFFINEDNEYDFNERNETWGLGIGLNSRSINFVGKIDYNAVSFRVSKWEYNATWKPPGDCWAIRFTHIKNLGADSRFKVDFSFDFGGDNS